MQVENNSLDSHLLFRLPAVFQYLRSRSLWITFFGLAVLSSLLEVMAFGIFGIFITLFVTGLEISMFFQITRSSAQGAKSFVAPDFRSLEESIFHPIILVIVASLPMIIAGYWGMGGIIRGGLPSGWPVGPLLLFAVGFLLFPLLLTIAAIEQSSLRVLNPVVWLQTLGSLRTNYIVAALGFYGLWGVEVYLVANVAEKIASVSFFGSSVPALLLMYVPRMLRYRLLGALCEPFLGEELPDSVIIPVAQVVSDIDDSEERLAELASGSMAPRSILRMANTAYSKERPTLVYRAVEYLWNHHRDSPEMTQGLWVASQAQEREGRTDAMLATLQRIIALDPNHPMASEARIKLRKF